MYKSYNNARSSRSGSNNSARGSFNRSPRSGGFNRSNRFGGQRRGGGSRRRNLFKSSNISHDRYIFKAPEVIESQIYVPQNSFEDFDIIEGLKKNIAKKGFTMPSKIQDQTIPLILEGKDVIGLASTGSGKTAAFLIPMIDKIYKNKAQQVLIIAPTRELATQIDEEFRAFAAGSGIRSVVVIGGASMGRQMQELKRNPNFVIGTPGRIMDLYDRESLKLERFNNIVLDEVDRMLDMGFVDEIKTIISKLQRYRQSLFFSATMSPEVNKIADSLLLSPIKVETEVQSTSKNVDQDVIRVKPNENKVEVLHEILIKEENMKVLIFSKTKRGADKLSTILVDRGFKADSIHGDKPQAKRDRVITKFKRDDIKILVATDVAARGIDIKDITHVINFDEPATYEDYIHRIGRTGRYNKKGKALTFIG